MNITGTFIDLLSGDIPAMNWGGKQWDREFAMMKSVGINTLILLRSSYKEWLCYRSEYMHKIAGCINPPVDSLKMLLQLAEKHGLNLYVGTYNSYHDWLTAAYNVDYEAELIMRSVDEIWRNYGDSPAFKGWYMTHEISRKLSFRIVELFQKVAPHCKKNFGRPASSDVPRHGWNKRRKQKRSKIGGDIAGTPRRLGLDHGRAFRHD